MITSRVERNVPSQADEAWKNVLEDFFPEIMAFCFPEIYSKIDWNKAWEFLDKEFQAIALSNVTGKRFVDKLTKVHLLTGKEQWLIIHIEVQGDHDKDFSKRMFIYQYRSFDKFGTHPISCAILTDESKSWRPSTYQYKFGSFEIFFKFYTVKLLDLLSQMELLEMSSNPIAAIILIQLKAIKSKKKSLEDKFNLKLSETKKLYLKFDKNTIRKIFYFIDFLISLPENLVIKYEEEIFKFEKDINMRERPMTSIEKLGFERGIRKGVQQEKKSIALLLLRDGQSINYIAKLTGLKIDELNILVQSVEKTIKEK